MGEIRFVGIGETRRYPYLVCKKIIFYIILTLTWIDTLVETAFLLVGSIYGL